MRKTLHLLACVLLPCALAARADELGVRLPGGAKKVAEHRFEVQRDFDGTIKHFKDEFKGSKSVRIGRDGRVAGVRFLHIDNANDKSAWSGINVYQLKDGLVRVYVLPREPKTAATTPAATPAAPK
jgi:hypothetical protein